MGQRLLERIRNSLSMSDLTERQMGTNGGQTRRFLIFCSRHGSSGAGDRRRCAAPRHAKGQRPARLFSILTPTDRFTSACYYDQTLGRFLNEDPIRFGAGPGFYSYVNNSPTNYVDPLGLQGVLGKNPFPKMSGRDLEVFSNALKPAIETACRPECDGALQDYGIKSLKDLVEGLTANHNVYDGRRSTYPHGDETMKDFLKKGSAAAVATTDLDKNLVFLGDKFWKPDSIDSIPQQRGLILLHEAVHAIGRKTDIDFGTSRKLSEIIAEKCFPILKHLKKLGTLTH